MPKEEMSTMQQKVALEETANMYGPVFVDFLKTQPTVLGAIEVSTHGVLPLFKQIPGSHDLPINFLKFLQDKQGNLPVAPSSCYSTLIPTTPAR